MFPAVSATQYPASWPGLSRPSTTFFRNEDVDARHKAGHDGGKVVANDQVICQANGETR